MGYSYAQAILVLLIWRIQMFVCMYRPRSRPVACESFDTSSLTLRLSIQKVTHIEYPPRSMRYQHVNSDMTLENVIYNELEKGERDIRLLARSI